MSHLSHSYEAYEGLDPDDDTSMLACWTDSKGRFFCHDDDGQVIELRDGDPWPKHFGIAEAPNERANRLVGLAICVFVALSTLMFIAQFIRAWLAGRL